MPDEKESSLISALSLLVIAHVKRIAGLVELATLEARLAAKSLVVLVVLLFVMGIALITTWLSANALLFVGLVYFGCQAVIASLAVFILNILALMYITTCIKRTKRNLTFPITRQELHKESLRENEKTAA